MNQVHKKKTVRYFVLALALVFACCTFSLTAFATEGNVGPSPESTNGTGQTLTGAGGSSAGGSSASSTPASSVPPKSSTLAKSSTPPKTTSSAKPSTKVSSTAPKKSTLSSNYESQADVTSENWKEVLSTVNSSEVSALASSEVSSAAPVQASDGGVSWMMIVGVILVVLGLGGIGFFIYIQFINKQETLEDITAQAKRQVKHSKSSAPRPRRK